MEALTPSWRDELEGWLQPFAASLGDRRRGRMCPLYVAGRRCQSKIYTAFFDADARLAYCFHWYIPTTQALFAAGKRRSPICFDKAPRGLSSGSSAEICAVTAASMP
jgi:hypothetical protein